MSSRWRQTTPEEVAAWLADASVPWGIAGGWALDLWNSGAPSRPHSDIEIACFRTDLPELLQGLAAFEISIARNKLLTPYRPAGSLPPPPYSLWLRRPSEPLWDFEIVAESRIGSRWAYRRQDTVTLPADAVFRAAGGLPIIAPEIQLLYKAKEPRPKDLDDLRRFVPRLDQAAHDWLRWAIVVSHPEFLATFDDLAGGGLSAQGLS